MDRHAIVRLRNLCALALSLAALSATPALAKAVASEAEVPASAAVQFSFDPAARAAWLDDCHRRIGYRDVDRATDSGECEAYLDSYAARYEAAARGEPGYVYGYVPVMMVPVAPSGAPSAPAPVQQPATASPSAAHSSPVIDYAYVDTGSRLSPGSKASQLR